MVSKINCLAQMFESENNGCQFRNGWALSNNV